MLKNPIEVSMKKSLRKGLAKKVAQIGKGKTLGQRMAKAIVAAGNSGPKAVIPPEDRPAPPLEYRVVLPDSDAPKKLTKEERKKARRKRLLASNARRKTRKRRK